MKKLTRLLKQFWRKSTWNKIIVVLIPVFLVLLIGGYSQNYYFSWVGLGDYKPPSGLPVEAERGKTLWDWMGLLLIPGILVVGGYFFSRAERKAEGEIAEERRREDTLQGYLDKMTELMLTWKLREAEEGNSVIDIARARTLTVLRVLDSGRNNTLFQFLVESDLLDRRGREGVISLSRADLIKADLSGAVLVEANLSGANLSGAFLMGANLIEADLIGAKLIEADLIGAKLIEADLSGAFLIEAFLIEADLSGADLREANLSKAKLIGAKLNGAKLNEADLRESDLSGARYNERTRWPSGFDPKAAGAILQNDVRVFGISKPDVEASG